MTSKQLIEISEMVAEWRNSNRDLAPTLNIQRVVLKGQNSSATLVFNYEFKNDQHKIRGGAVVESAEFMRHDAITRDFTVWLGPKNFGN